jgi:hypothetical protein
MSVATDCLLGLPRKVGFLSLINLGQLPVRLFIINYLNDNLSCTRASDVIVSSCLFQRSVLE